MEIYIDGSYKTRQCFTNSELISFTSAILVNEVKDKPIIKDYEIKRCKNLKTGLMLRHYGNLAELSAAGMAMDYLKENNIEQATIYTDSKTLVSWTNSAKKNKKKKFATKHHLEIYNLFVKDLAYMDIEFIWIPREQNKIGIILEELGYE